MTTRELLKALFQRTGAEFVQLRFGRPGTDGWIRRQDVLKPRKPRRRRGETR